MSDYIFLNSVKSRLWRGGSAAYNKVHINSTFATAD